MSYWLGNDWFLNYSPSTVTHIWQNGVFYAPSAPAAGIFRFYVMSDIKPESWDSGALATAWRSWKLDTVPANYEAPPRQTCGGSCLIIAKVATVDYIYSFGGSCTTAVQRYKIVPTVTATAIPGPWESLGDMPGDAFAPSWVAIPSNNNQIIVTTSSGTLAIWNLLIGTWQAINVPSGDIAGSDLLVAGSDYFVYAGEGGNNNNPRGKQYTYWTTNQGQPWTDITTGNGNSGHWASSTICIPRADMSAPSAVVPAACTGF